jgi:hypothetical protein
MEKSKSKKKESKQQRKGDSDIPDSGTPSSVPSKCNEDAKPLTDYHKLKMDYESVVKERDELKLKNERLTGELMINGSVHFLVQKLTIQTLDCNY